MTVALEWWAFEVVTVIGGLFGYEQLGAQSIAFSFNALIFQFALGMSAGTSTMVGGCVAHGNIKTAKTYMWYSLIGITGFMVPMLIIMVYNPRVIMSVYTSNELVQDILIELL